MAELEARGKLIEAMALDRCPKDDGMGCEKACPRCREWFDVTLAAIAEQGYAVVPRELAEKICHDVECRDEPNHVDGEPMCVEYWQDRWGFLIAAVDLARPDPAREDKP